MPDIYVQQAPDLAGPASGVFDITPSDSTDLTVWTRAIWVGAGGTVKVTVQGVAVTFAGCATGSILPVRAQRVWATGTTATSLIGLT